LASVESLRQAAWGAARALDPGDDQEGQGVLALLAEAAAQLGAARGADGRLDELAARVEALAYEADELARELGAYRESLEADPERLGLVEQRLDLLARLKRKHGGTIGAVLEHAERCRSERDRLSNAGETTARLEQELLDAS